MKRSFEAADMMVVVGFCATIAGGLLFFMASNGVFGYPAGAAVSSTRSLNEMELIEPALGSTIVKNMVFESAAGRDLGNAATQFTRALIQQYGVEGAENDFVDPIAGWAARMESDNAARAEWVKGRTIANFTRRGVAQGWLSADHYLNEYNDRMIRHAEAAGSRIVEEFFSSRQPVLGRAIVEAGQAHVRLLDRTQEAIGAAVLRVTHAQTQYEETSSMIQTQLAALTNAAIRAELQADLFDQLAQLEAGAQPRPVTTLVRTWPEITTGHMVAAMTVLLGLLLAGFFVPTRRTSEDIIPYGAMESAERVYRKTA